jgi:uncharacterized membrane protein YidH (DUF202 family)
VFLLGGWGDMAGLVHRIADAGVDHVVLLTSRCVIGGKPDNAITRRRPCIASARPCSTAPARGRMAAVAARTPQTADAETALNVGMAAERTWLAWWRTALVATAGALGVGRLAPRLLHASPAPYVVLGCGYAVLALALLIVGSRRYRALATALERGEPAPLAATTVTLFTVGGVVLATVTTVVVLAEI